jgi:uncharacterized protein YutE (UPF0331/DUF86 family)
LGRLLAAHPEVDFAYLFGSFAEGGPYHDVDVAVFLWPAPPASTLLDYEMDLSTELIMALHMEVDVHVLNGAPVGFQQSAVQGELLLVHDEERLSDFIADERNLYTVMHLLLEAIEAVAALCTHILAKTARRAPTSYAECFEGLREVHQLDDALVARLIQTARFRSLLVHRYWEVDPARVLRYARANLGDFDDYLSAVGPIVGVKV